MHYIGRQLYNNDNLVCYVRKRLWYGTQLSTILAKFIITYHSSDICQVTHLDISCLFYQWYALPTNLSMLLFSYCTHCLYARAPSPYLTHSLGCFLTTLNLYVQIGCFISFIRCCWARTLCEELEFLSSWLLVFLSLFHPVVIPFPYSLLSCVDDWSSIMYIIIHIFMFNSC